METSQINKTMNTKWNDDAFARMVAEEVKNKTSLQEREELQNPDTSVIKWFQDEKNLLISIRTAKIF